MSEKIIRFEQGIPGFKEETEFIYLMQDEESPFGYLQSIKNDALSFIVVSPFVFFQEYEFTLSAEVITRLEITSAEDVMLLTIVTIRDELANATVNLVGPIVINLRNFYAEQVILEGTHYSTRHKLFPHLESVGGK